MTEEQVSHFVDGCTYVELVDDRRLIYYRLPVL